MKHTHEWYAELADQLGHPGYVTMGEVRQAEARECRDLAATAKWRKRGTSYHLDLDGNYYVVGHEDGLRTWQIQAWPTALPGDRYVRTQGRIRTRQDAMALALAMPCFRCGLANHLPLMERRMPARPSLADVISERWRCKDSAACFSERSRLTDDIDYFAWTAGTGGTELILSNPATGQSVPVTVDPATGRMSLRKG